MRHYSIGKDGLTPEQRKRGPSRVKPIVQFGERALFRLAHTVKLEKEQARWAEGIFLGILDISQEYIFGNKCGVMRTTYPPHRLEKHEQWSVPMLRER